MQLECCGLVKCWSCYSQSKEQSTLKRALIEEPVLHLPVFKKPFQIFADAIDFAIGALHNQGGDGVYKPMH